MEYDMNSMYMWWFLLFVKIRGYDSIRDKIENDNNKLFSDIFSPNAGL